MLYNILTVFLMTTALMPPAMLQYYAFEPLLSQTQKIRVLGGYATLYLIELLFFLYMFIWGPWDHSFTLYKKIFVVAWIPHFLWAIATIRPYLFRHLYVFSIRAACTILIHTLSALILLALFHDPGSRPILPSLIYPAQWLFYIFCYLALLPVLRRYFNEVFVKYRYLTTHKYWKYISMLPLFLLLDMYFILAHTEDLIMDRMLLPRMILLLALIIIAVSIRVGLRQADRTLKMYERVENMTAQIEASRDYTHSLLNSQDQLKGFYDSRKAYLDKLEGLISSHQPQEALQFIKEIGTQLDQTKQKQYCQNPLVNAALSTYLAKAEALHIPITVKAVIPKENAALSSDLAIVLSNLIENAIHASEKQPDSHRALSLLTLCQGDVLNILVKNRFDGTVTFDEDGLPTTQAKGHGIGMKSLSHFRDTYDASVLCTCEDGWFSTYIRVPWGEGSPS